MRRYRLLTLLLAVSVLTLSACAKGNSAEAMNESEGEVQAEREALDVMTDELKERYLNAEKGELMYVTIKLQDDIIPYSEREKIARKNAEITAEERALLDDRYILNEVEVKKRDAAKKRIDREMYKWTVQYYENKCMEFLKSTGIDEDRYGYLYQKEPEMHKVDLTKEEILEIALRPEVEYMDYYDCRRPPVLKIDTEKYDHMLSCVYWDVDTILRPLALNKNKIEAVGYGIEIIKFDTMEELKEFKLTYSEELELDRTWDEVKSFNANTLKYDEQFFEENTLMAIFYLAGSCSMRYGVYDIVTDGNKVCFEVTETTGAEAGDCGMAGWIITVVVSDDEAKAWKDYDVRYVDGQEKQYLLETMR